LHLSRETGSPLPETKSVGSKIRFPEPSSTGNQEQFLRTCVEDGLCHLFQVFVIGAAELT
jgi:hypothetical protein